jgi:K+/H+ antiporter YhaU regulatory subunit KhtT
VDSAALSLTAPNGHKQEATGAAASRNKTGGSVMSDETARVWKRMMSGIRTVGWYLKASILLIWVAPLIVQASSVVSPTRGESRELTQLLQDASDEAQRLAIDAQDTQALITTDKNWITHALALAKIKGHVDNMSLIIDKLSNAQKSGSKLQEEAVQRIIPLVNELSENTQAAIDYLNRNKNRPDSETYREYLEKNAETARQLASVVEALLDYEKSMSEIQKLRSKLTNERPANRPGPVSQTQTHPQKENLYGSTE